MKIYTITILLVLFFYYGLMAQISYDRRENIQLIDSAAYNTFKISFPITRDTLNSYPDSLLLTGRLVDFTLGVSCGYFCGCGTGKIKLASKVEGYPFDHIYIAIPCFNTLTKEFENTRAWKLFKLPVQDTRCYWTEVPMNKFDTKGLPFYIMERHRKKQKDD